MARFLLIARYSGDYSGDGVKALAETVMLMTPEEIDSAAGQDVGYVPPGR